MPDTPVSYTTYIGLAKWNENQNPGASALNNNWDLLDSAIHSTSQSFSVQSPLAQSGNIISLSYNQVNFKLVSASLNTIQDISTGSNTIFNRCSIYSSNVETIYLSTLAFGGVVGNTTGQMYIYQNASGSDMNFLTRKTGASARTNFILYSTGDAWFTGSISAKTITAKIKDNFRTITGSYSASVYDKIIYCSGSGNINLFLYGTNEFPSSSLTIKITTDGINLYIYPSGSDLIESETDALISTNGTSLEIFPVNGNWNII